MWVTLALVAILGAGLVFCVWGGIRARRGQVGPTGDHLSEGFSDEIESYAQSWRSRHPVVYVISVSVTIALVYWFAAATWRENQENLLEASRADTYDGRAVGVLSVEPDGALRFLSREAEWSLDQLIIVAAEGRPNDADGFEVFLSDGSVGDVEDLADGDAVEVRFTGLCQGEPRTPPLIECDLLSVRVTNDASILE